MQYVSRNINQEELDKLISFYKDFEIEVKGDYLMCGFENENAKILVYTSKNGYKVSYQGNNALYEAKILFNDVTLHKAKEKVETSFLDFEPQIGSDEVGTGDLFGPIVVTACYFDKNILKKIDNFKIDDSKKLTDKKILESIDKIIKDLTFSKFTLMPEKYNELIKKGYNMNEIKAILHNLALTSLSKKVAYKNIYIDQFCEESIYYHYLDKAKQKAIRGINFHIKGESYYPCIALASMISRYSFLKTCQEMCKEYNLDFPKGASIKCDGIINQFIQKYGKDELYKVAKMNFKILEKYY